jgi:tRNA (guanine37-N1)-methyltransferase
MRIDIITIFPRLFHDFLRTGLLGKSIAAGVVNINVHDLRAHGFGKHRSVDDTPYGGGPGMVMRPEPIFDAVDALREPDSHIVLMSARGHLLDHQKARDLGSEAHLIIVCGRYEGVDERVAAHLVDEELSIGDYVLAGGELPALVVIEAASRFVPGVLGNVESLASESHAEGLLEYPQFTRPPEYRGYRVPAVLLSGDHGAIERWRQQESKNVTRARRPDLLDG